MDEIYTLVIFNEDNTPKCCVSPVDDSGSSARMMLVCRGLKSAESAANYQVSMYGFDARPMLLSEVIERGIR